MYSVHDISTHAQVQVSIASLSGMGADLCAGNASGREPWATTARKPERPVQPATAVARAAFTA
jgi:hypothetical protein